MFLVTPQGHKLKYIYNDYITEGLKHLYKTGHGFNHEIRCQCFPHNKKITRGGFPNELMIPIKTHPEVKL